MGAVPGQHKPKLRRQAFTLAEALLASTVLAIVAATATLPFVAGVQQAGEAANLDQAIALGQAMMEEVLARPFYEPGLKSPAPGPNAGESTRNLFDNLDDFHGFAEASGNLRDYQNTIIASPSESGYWREVSVSYVTFPNQAPNDTNSFVHVQVRVWRDTTLMAVLDRIVSRED